MKNIQRSLVRAHLAAVDLVEHGGRRRERGDVPGWVLITLMTAGLVAVLWTVADTQLQNLFSRAISKVSGR